MTTIFETLDNNYITFEKKEINIIIDNNDTLWFNANDLTKALGYDKPKRVVQVHIDNTNKTQLQNIEHCYNINKHPQSIYISESGLYALLIKSKKPNAKKFTSWITGEVMPSLRKYGYYKMKVKYEQDKTGLLHQINVLKKQNKTMLAHLKKDKYPDGALVYIIDYSEEDKTLPGIYRLGRTKNLKARKEIYDTHTLNKNKVVHYELVDDPIRLEYCMRTMLYKYRYMDNRDFFVCKLSVIKRVFKKCLCLLKSVNSNVQTGGCIHIDNTLSKLNFRLRSINQKIDKYNRLLD